MLTLVQPWASLVAIGAKRIETRGWSTPYRGLLLIHAGKAWSRSAAALCQCPPFATALGLPEEERRETPRRGLPGAIGGGIVLPIGAVVAVARLADCRSARRIVPCPDERAFGDYSPGRYGLLLDDVRSLSEPLPCRGHLGLRPPADPGIVAEALRRAGVAA
jgi:hypothetical protein